MKKILSLFIVFCLTSGSTTLVSGQEFTDTSNTWAKDVIQKWSNNEYISGFDDGTFRPSSYATRAEAASIIDKYMKYEVLGENTFSDMTGGEWFANSLLKNVAVGNLRGYDGKIQPLEYITRQELAALICNAFDIAIVEGDTTFNDNYNISDWARGSVKALQYGGYLKDFTLNKFAPTLYVTRAELIVILDSVVNTIELEKCVDTVE